MDRPIPLDEYPVHQAPLSMKHHTSSDRNAYDRCIFHIFDHHGQALLIAGLGVYPNTGVIDAYATLRLGDRLHAVRASDALTDDRMNLAVGPLRIRIDVPLRRITLSCVPDPADPQGLSFDIAWDAAFDPVWEPHHTQRRGNRLTLEGRRFVQAGTCTGVIRAGGHTIDVTHDGWTGTRDRSWGVRPIPGESDGRTEEFQPEGFYWVWAPVRFEDRFLIVIAQEDADGYRTLSEALMVRNGHADTQLGRPHADIAYRPGTRHPTGAVIHLTDRDRKPLEMTVQPLVSSPLAVGAGYPPASDWQHGTWQGRDWTDRQVFDLSDPSAHPIAAYGVTDHASRFTLDGLTGYGIFEHGSVGRHDPSGFTGFADGTGAGS